MDKLNPQALQRVDLQLSVAQFLADYPAAVPFFLKRHMLCPGCSLSAFDTLADAARNYSIPADRFLNELVRWIEIHSQGEMNDRPHLFR
jgi:hybrid cluster-associated redox disulfide protein